VIQAADGFPQAVCLMEQAGVGLIFLKCCSK